VSRQIETWEALVANVSPFLTSIDPLDAMSKAGFVFGGKVGKALHSSPTRHFPADAFDRLQKKFGPPPPMRLSVGRKHAVIAPLIKPGDNQLRATLDLGVLNQVVGAYFVSAIPHLIGPDELDHMMIKLSDLKNLCVGVPAAAQAFQGLELTAPPAFSAGQTPTSVHLAVGIRLIVQSSPPTALVCTLELEIPLVFTQTAPVWFDNVVLTATGVELQMDPASQIIPKSTAAKLQLGKIFQGALPIIAPLIGAEVNISTFYAGVTLGQFKAVTRRGGTSGFATVGTSAAGQPDASAANLLGEPLPASDVNFHLAADQSFLSAVLNAAIDNGSFADQIKEGLSPGTTVNVHKDSGSVLFDAGQVVVSVDLTAINACGKKDLDMTVIVSGAVGVSAGGLAVSQPNVHVDLDDVDALICALSGIVAGPFGIVMSSYELLTLNPTVGDQGLPGISSFYLSGAEEDFNLQFVRATTNTSGTLLADATASVTPDTARSFLYLQFVSGRLPGLARPVAGATIELFELDNPAPAGDDVHVTLHPRPGHQLTYTPLNDQALGKTVTDANGVVRYAVIPNNLAGFETETERVEDPQTGKIVTVVTGRQAIPEAKPDFGVNVTAADGTVLARRLLVALNVAGKHVGTFAKPFIVNLDQVVVTPGKT
jgi:hypothetical protein